MDFDNDGLKNITSIDQIAGTWWVTKGLNPHYDVLPCLHNAYIKEPTNETKWIANDTWIDNFSKPPQYTSVQPEVLMNATQPGVFWHWYDWLDQLEPQVVVSRPHPDYMLELWCGSNPALKYAGGLLMTRNKDISDMPDWINEEFRKVVAKYGLDWDKDWIINDVSKCPD